MWIVNFQLDDFALSLIRYNSRTVCSVLMKFGWKYSYIGICTSIFDWYCFLLFLFSASRIRYEITSGNIGGAFAVKNMTGAIYVAGALDYETRKRVREDLLSWIHSTFILIRGLFKNGLEIWEITRWILCNGMNLTRRSASLVSLVGIASAL